LISLISNNKENQYGFSEICKRENIEYNIIEGVVEFVEYMPKINGGQIILDINNVEYGEIFNRFKKQNSIFKDSITLGEEVNNINEALAIIRFNIKKGLINEFPIDKERIIKEIMNKYGFKEVYGGYKCLLEICKQELLNRKSQFLLKSAICQVSNKIGETEINIQRSIRYMIDINNNEQIKSIRDNGGMKVKNVVLFLINKVYDKLGNRWL